jgi:hypothetical protein
MLHAKYMTVLFCGKQVESLLAIRVVRFVANSGTMVTVTIFP